MAWFGASLNDSLSNLKGQISNLTKEVLTDEYSIEGEETQVVPHERFKELQTIIDLQKHDIEDLRKCRSELEERLTATDLQSHQQTASLKQQVKELQSELENIKQKHTDWNWQEQNVNGPATIHANDVHENSNPSTTMQPCQKCTEYQTISKRIQNEKDELQKENQQLQQNLEDLDAQHQMIIDQMLQKKTKLQEELNITLAKNFAQEETIKRLNEAQDSSRQDEQAGNNSQLTEQLENKIAELTGELDKLTNTRQAEAEKSAQQIHMLMEELTSYKSKFEDQKAFTEELTVYKSKFEEQRGLIEELGSYKSKFDEQRGLIEELGSYKSKFDEQRGLIEELGSYKSKFEEQRGLIEELGSYKSKFEEQRGLIEELHSYKSRFEEHKVLSDQLKEDLVTSSSATQTIRQECNMLKAKLDSVLTSLNPLASAISGVNTIDVNNVENCINSFTIRFQDIKNKALEAENYNAILTNNIAELKTHLQQKEDECRKLRASCEVTEIENEQTEKCMKKLKNDQETKLNEAKTQIVDLNKKIADLETRIRYKTEQESLFNEQLMSLQNNLAKSEAKLKSHEKEKNSYLDEARKLASSHDVIALEDVLEFLRDSLQEKCLFENQLKSALDELRDAQELMDRADTDKNDLEKECENLRDQLEELQGGERQQPEGSVAARGLPTIQEEETDSPIEKEEAQILQQPRESPCVGSVNDEMDDSKGKVHRISVELVAALEAKRELETDLEAKKSLEDELARAKEQNYETSRLLTAATNELKALTNCQKEAVIKKEKCEALEQELARYKSDMDKMKADLDRVSTLEKEIDTLRTEKAQLEETAATVQVVNVEKRMLEQQLLEAEQGLRDKQENILYLEQKISTIQTHDVTSIYSDDTDKRCIELQADLDKIRTQLIYRDDLVDTYQRCLNDIAFIFKIEDTSVMTFFSKMSIERNKILEEMEKLKKEISEFNETSKGENSDMDSLKEQLEKLKIENENLNKTSQQQKNEAISEDNANNKHIKEIETLNAKNTELNTSLIEKQKLIDNNQHTIKTLEQKIQELETTVAQNMNSNNNENQAHYETLLQQTKHDNEINISKIREEKDGLLQQLSTLTSERTQMISTLNQKHQESLTYHGELQKLLQVLAEERQKTESDKQTLYAQLNQEQSLRSEIDQKLAQSNQKLTELSNQKSQQTNQTEVELKKVKKELEQSQIKVKQTEQERDQLRVANATFNSQYQDLSKELASAKERENQLSQKCDRLQQHLTTVEETYTAEALGAEEREATLRATLTKLEDKLTNHSTLYNSVSQRANVQVESLQDQIQNLTAQRDDAVARLQVVEESSEQHLHSLNTLQQVLQDFRKRQDRDIAEATERERKKLDKVVNENKDLNKEIEALKDQLKNKESALSVTTKLHQQLDTYQQMVISLKAQVATQEQAMRKSKDEMLMLRSSTEAKIDKHLIRNLVVGYFATPNDKRDEVLHVIATVLDLSPEERLRTGLDKQGTSWLSSLANFLAPPASNVVVASKVDVLDHTTLSQAFVRFLEDESSPRPTARLPAIEMAEETQEKAEKKAKAKAQAQNSGKTSPFLKTVESNRSPTSSPLLSAVSPAAFTPVTLADSSSSNNLDHEIIIAGTQDSTHETNKILSNLLADNSNVKDENAN